jgi:hypothetical protein
MLADQDGDPVFRVVTHMVFQGESFRERCLFV